MKIEILYFEGCPNHRLTVQRIRDVLDRLGIDAKVHEIEVSPDDDPAELRFIGSPTVLVDGVDIDPTQRAGATYGFGCRTYPGDGLPPTQMIGQALRLSNGGGDGTAHDAHSLATQGGVRDQTNHRGFFWSGLGAVGTAVGASACCWLPAVVGTVGISLAGAGAWFKATRPWLLGAAGIMLAYGFYKAYFARPSCATDSHCRRTAPQNQRRQRVSLWLTAAIVVAVALLPYYSPWLTQAFAGSSKAHASSGGGVPAPTTTRISAAQFSTPGNGCRECIPSSRGRIRYKKSQKKPGSP